MDKSRNESRVEIKKETLVRVFMYPAGKDTVNTKAYLITTQINGT